jgi:hypothetical protein
VLQFLEVEEEGHENHQFIFGKKMKGEMGLSNWRSNWRVREEHCCL